jgi:hypothetical protein
MYELLPVAAAYVVGTAAGIWIFRMWVKETIITATLDSLITQGYLRSYEDDEGTTQLLQFDEMSPEEVDRALARVLESIEKYEEEASEEDDTP